jgi:hypothetical protein
MLYASTDDKPAKKHNALHFLLYKSPLFFYINTIKEKSLRYFTVG